MQMTQTSFKIKIQKSGNVHIETFGKRAVLELAGNKFQAPKSQKLDCLMCIDVSRT